jgi:hypothetical protein
LLVTSEESSRLERRFGRTFYFIYIEWTLEKGTQKINLWDVGGREGYDLFKVLFKTLPAGTTITDAKHHSGQPVAGNDYKMAASKWILEEPSVHCTEQDEGEGEEKGWISATSEHRK